MRRKLVLLIVALGIVWVTVQVLNQPDGSSAPVVARLGDQDSRQGQGRPLAPFAVQSRRPADKSAKGAGPAPAASLAVAHVVQALTTTSTTSTTAAAKPPSTAVKTHPNVPPPPAPAGPAAVKLLASGCTGGFRATSQCSAWGPPDSAADVACDGEVPRGRSGYCVCAIQGKDPLHRGVRIEFDCDHDPFTCQHVCAQYDATVARPLAESTAQAQWLPPIVHQSWKSNSVPTETARYQQKWLDLQEAGWQYRFHSDADNLALVEQRFPWFVAVYRSFSFIWSAGVARADAMRYMYLFDEGGLYADLDFEPLNPLFSETANTLFARARAPPGTPADVPCQCVIGQEPLEHAAVLEGRTHFVCNALMLSVPKHPFWLHVLATVQARRATVYTEDPVTLTGPRMLQEALDTYERLHIARTHPVCMAPASLFFPYFDATIEDKLRGACAAADYAPAPPPAPPLDYTKDGLASLAHQTYFREHNQPGLSVRSITADVCARLRLTDFKNAPSRAERSVAAHHWRHYWLANELPGRCDMVPPVAAGGPGGQGGKWVMNC